MKIPVLLIALIPLSVYAQNSSDTEVKDSVALNEVVVNSARVRNIIDGMRYVPDSMVRERSNNAYTLLDKLALPNIRVDVAERTISIPPSMGTLQIRINGVVATMQDLISLSPQSVRYIDYITNPGARYGRDVDVVISITTIRASSGYTVGTDLLQALTTRRGDDNIFFRKNSGMSELGIDYGFNYLDFRHGEYAETADYLMPAGNTQTVIRSDHGMHRRAFNHNLQLRYSLAVEDRFTFLATLNGSFTNTPDNSSRRKEVTDEVVNDFSIVARERSASPVLDLFTTVNLNERQSITASATGTYINSSYRYNYASGVPYAYSTDGRTWSLMSEAVYENRLRPFTLSAGGHFNQSYVRNIYKGDASAANAIRTSDTDAFISLKGKLGRLDYTAGAGVGRLYYRQDSHSYEYWLLKPQLVLVYALPWNLQMKYELSLTDRPPRLEYLGDVATRRNTFETELGNASLRPTRVVEHQAYLSVQKPAVFAQVMAMYRCNMHATAQQTFRRDSSDGTSDFVTMRSNNSHIDMLLIAGYCRWDIIKDRLSLNGNANLARCFNYGPDYKHHYTSFNYIAGLTAYAGRFTLYASVDNGWAFLENEFKAKNTFSSYCSVSYKMGRADISLIWKNLFSARNVSLDAELLNRYVHRTMLYRNGDLGNMISLNFSWSLSRGRKYKDVNRRIPSGSVDSGIRRVDATSK